MTVIALGLMLAIRIEMPRLILQQVPLDWSAKQQGQLLPGAPKEGKVRGGVATVMTGGEVCLFLAYSHKTKLSIRR